MDSLYEKKSKKKTSLKESMTQSITSNKANVSAQQL